MKKITLSIIAVFVVATTLVSCSKDDKTTDSIQGKWTIESAVAGIPDLDPQNLNISGDCTERMYFDLKTAGNMEEADLNTETCELIKLNGTWKKTNNRLEVETSNGKTAYNIISNSTSKLVLHAADLPDGAPEGAYIELTFLKK